MTKPEFPGTAVALALFRALEAWHDKMPAVTAEITRVVERHGNISGDALADTLNELHYAFDEKLYQELKDQGVEIT